MFESRITRQLGTGQTPNVTDVTDLYERLVVVEPIMKTMITIVQGA